MIIFLFVGVFSSFVAVAMLIAMLKCCVESLSNGTSDHQKLGIMNTYQSRHSNSNTYRRNTYDADDLAEVWTTNDDNPAGNLSFDLTYQLLCQSNWLVSIMQKKKKR